MFESILKCVGVIMANRLPCHLGEIYLTSNQSELYGLQEGF